MSMLPICDSIVFNGEAIKIDITETMRQKNQIQKLVVDLCE